MGIYEELIPWTKKPDNETGLINSRLTDGLIVSLHLHEHDNATTIINNSHYKKIDDLTGFGLSSGFSSSGQHISTDSSITSGIYQNTGKSVHSGNITIVAVGRFKTSGAINQIVAADSDLDSARDFQFRFTDTNKLQFIPFVGSTPYTSLVGSTTKNTTDVITVAATYDGSIAKVFFEGELDGSDSSMSGSLDAYDATLSVGFRNRKTSSLDQQEKATTDFYQLYIWNRALSDSDIKYLSKNPWALRRPSTVHLPYSSASGGSGTTSYVTANITGTANITVAKYIFLTTLITAVAAITSTNGLKFLRLAAVTAVSTISNKVKVRLFPNITGTSTISASKYIKIYPSIIGNSSISNNNKIFTSTSITGNSSINVTDSYQTSVTFNTVGVSVLAVGTRFIAFVASTARAYRSIKLSISNLLGL